MAAAMAVSTLPPLVLIPGLLCNGRVFKHVIGMCRAAGVSVTTVDTTRHDTIAAAAKAVLDETPHERFAVAGFSFGGYVALEVGHQQPHRLAALAMLSSQARPDAESTKQRRLHQMAVATAAGSLEPVLVEHVPSLLHPSHLPPGFQAALTREGVASLAHSHDAFATVVTMAHEVGVDGFVRQQRAIMSRSDRRSVLSTLATTRKPFLVTAGAMDGLIPLRAQFDMWRVVHNLRHPSAHAPARHAPALAPHTSTPPPATNDGHNLPDGEAGDAHCRMVTLPQCGHMSVLESGHRTGAALLAWLAASSPA